MKDPNIRKRNEEEVNSKLADTIEQEMEEHKHKGRQK